MAKGKRVRHAAKRMPVFATGGVLLTAADILLTPPDGFEGNAGPVQQLMAGEYNSAVIRLKRNATDLGRYKFAVMGVAASYAGAKLKLNRFLPFRM